MSKLLEVKSLTVAYDGGRKAIHNINLDIKQNEVIAIVGESGCGKSTLIKSIFHLLPSNANVEAGAILFNGEDLLTLNQKQWRHLRGNEITMIFQNPGSYMNPIMKIGKQFVESIRTHRNVSKAEAIKKAKAALVKMELPDTDRILNSYPFQLSGGMKQRVAISMALCMEPQLILADEPTSALDVVTQIQIMDEFLALKEEVQSSIIWITHNIGTAAYMADRIVVMHKGEIVEFDEKDHIISRPQKEYTRKLLDAIPELKGSLP
ncbi:ABC transporter ATP-binding protein [Sporosarcina sp. FSL W7-1349]|uniref:ABC transporter ATP-binding protein n=1 Tax=Sporosarcina sp. FSL W7-1349 TaxID=2921561 RepID=UPI0030F907EE